MLKPFSFFLIFFISLNAYSSGIPLKDAPIGENRIKYSRKDIDINITSFKDFEIKAIVDNSSFEWVRVNQVLLIPRVRLKIKINSSDPKFYVHYKNSVTSFQQSKKNSYTEIFYSLFERKKVKLFQGETIIGEITIDFKEHNKKKLLVDYTCSRNGIKVDGLTSEHFSIGCHTRRVGSFGKEKPMLEIQWISPELKIIESEYVPYQAAFLNHRPVRIKVLNIKTNEEKEIVIHARIGKRLHRMFTAYGFGPYALDTETIDKDGKTLKKNTPFAPALFFYLNYKISDSTSIRGFDAAIFQESRFNNAGIYFGSDFGFALDNKLYFTTLLGVQYLYFKFDDLNPEVSEPIFPQGIEFMYRHLFDEPNYIVSGGLFLSTTESIEYENIWVRWGKNYFWELNLISWAKDDFRVKTWGLSVGFPFKGFL